MPRVLFNGQELSCDEGDNLRTVLTDAEQSPHNGKSALVNCRGLGTCGTCAVEVRGAINPMSVRERLRLTAPPHDLRDGLRLACFVEVQGDVSVVKHEGFWGQEVRKAAVNE